jgi:hypothetical protein
MLKITNNKIDGGATLTLEGKLAGAWVDELRRCWRRLALIGDAKPVSVDLSGVTWVSDEGKALLRVMRRGGAELLAANMLVAGIVAEINAETME